MKIYQTESGLGYKQLAYLLEFNEGLGDSSLICIGTKNFCGDELYVVGDVYRGDDKLGIHLEETTKKTADFEFCNSYLFRFWFAYMTLNKA